MAITIEKATGIGLCFGVKRAIDLLDKAAREHGGVETLGEAVHNQQVLQRLAKVGIRAARDVNDIQSKTVAIGAHGVPPLLEEELRGRHINLIDTTCPFVHRAQIAARKLVEAGFFVIIYGDANHPEVSGVLGWANGRGAAMLNNGLIAKLDSLPRHIGILSQTTQIPAHFAQFVKKLIDSTLIKDSELRIIDTICHDIRTRQSAALKLADNADLMLVIGSHTSANTNCLARLCSEVTKTYIVETADEIQSSWLQEQHRIGITAGASTAEETINEVITRLEAMA